MNLHPYIAPNTYIDCHHSDIKALARQLAFSQGNDVAVVQACFEWVRDNIDHSGDFERNPITCKASDVLSEGTGYCYAKSHLLVALLRANAIPAGLCYQRLQCSSPEQYCLHGLCAVHLPAVGWYRMDPRGNTSGVQADFMPPVERLAWTGDQPGEFNFPDVWANPMPSVTHVLTHHHTWDAVMANLPDQEPSPNAHGWHDVARR